MTKKLEQLFDIDAFPKQMPPEEQEEVRQALQVAREVELQLPSNPEDRTDKELDELTSKALSSFDDLMSLGMNVEARFSAPIFDSASKMFGHAVTAKLGKAQKKLKETELKMRLMKQQQQNKDDQDNPIEVNATVMDRNELIRMLRSEKSDPHQ
jgi:hypothetical protein